MQLRKVRTVTCEGLINELRNENSIMDAKSVKECIEMGYTLATLGDVREKRGVLNLHYESVRITDIQNIATEY